MSAAVIIHKGEHSTICPASLNSSSNACNCLRHDTPLAEVFRIDETRCPGLENLYSMSSPEEKETSAKKHSQDVFHTDRPALTNRRKMEKKEQKAVIIRKAVPFPPGVCPRRDGFEPDVVAPHAFSRPDGCRNSCRGGDEPRTVFVIIGNPLKRRLKLMNWTCTLMNRTRRPFRSLEIPGSGITCRNGKSGRTCNHLVDGPVSVSANQGLP